MSASNWTTCPRCRDRARDEAEARRLAADEAYGKVPAGEYEQLRAAALVPVALEPTFREDYEFYGAGGGEVTASYGGYCQVCGLGTSFKYEHPFYQPTHADG